MKDWRIIDSHIHCGIQNVDFPYEVVKPLLDQAGIEAACLFAPVEDIYDRYDPDFQDSDSWRRSRQAANHYLLELASRGEPILPYLFVWNDFALEELEQDYYGVKWHRHPNEPVYHYDDPRCQRLLEEITRLRLPVVLEESFANTRRFLEVLAPEAVVIIPHLGALNGSYPALESAGLWQRPNTYADSALASPAYLRDFLRRYGPERLLFGSDFPFGLPTEELGKIKKLGLSDADLEKVLGGNLLRLVSEINRQGWASPGPRTRQ